MGSKSKNAAFLICILALLVIVFIQPATAQSTTKPSMPKFTVELADPAFDIPPAYSFNASTGLFDANDGYHIEYSTVKIVIENQPVCNQTNHDYLYYNVRIKPHNYADSYWYELFHAGADGYPMQTLSNYTVIPLLVEGNQELGIHIPTGETTDIQVQAMLGHIERGFNPNATNQIEMYPYVFAGEVSGWSSTQTVTVPPKTPFSASPPSTPTYTPTPTSSGTPSDLITLPATVFVILVAALSMGIVVLLVLLIRKAKLKHT
jgi:Predicted solute binding protein